MPHELNALWCYNRAQLAAVLFAAVSATLRELLGDPRHLGAEAGWLLALHTWSRSLALHPHIHALVTDGGLCGDAWVSPRRSHFLPARVVMVLFRGKFLARLRRPAAPVVCPVCQRPIRFLGRLAHARPPPGSPA